MDAPKAPVLDPRRGGIVQLGGARSSTSRTAAALQAALSDSSDDSSSDSDSDSGDPSRVQRLEAAELPRYQLAVSSNALPKRGC